MKKGVKKIIGGGILFVIGMILPFAFIIPLVFQTDDITFRAPGSVDVIIEKPGRYYLYNNYSTVFEGRSYSFAEELPHGLSFSLIEKESGASVPMNSDLSISSEAGSQLKSSIGYFKLIRPGQYTLTVSGNMEDRIFSFGESFFGHRFKNMILGMLVAFAAAITALVLIVLGIVDLVRESKSANQRVQTQR